ncbi:MAG: hypothetical protein FJZ87_08465 [Chloroflexi bacterium]|nr:hypothetical protein [Chloroflexota bacterium]
MPNLIGKRLGKVQITEMIARGGMAEVYLGEHTTLNRKVAVKIMRDHVDSDPELRGRFEREARVVAGLRHPISSRCMISTWRTASHTWSWNMYREPRWAAI